MTILRDTGGNQKLIVTKFDKSSLPHTSNYSPINTHNFTINDGIDPEILLYLSRSSYNNWCKFEDDCIFLTGVMVL